MSDCMKLAKAWTCSVGKCKYLPIKKRTYQTSEEWDKHFKEVHHIS